jgi:5-methyltetrahydrofolate--homocysteine methyltransferase
MFDGEKFYVAISEGKMDEVKQLTQEALGAGESAETILKGGLIPAMDRVGVRFKNDEIYIPEVLIAARAMNASMAILKPMFSQSTGIMVGKVVIGTVKGDLHDIGKNLVIMMLEGAGFEVIDLGVDVPASKFIDVIQKDQPQVVGLSALLTTTMSEMKKTIKAFETAGFRKQIKVIIGGAPVTEKFAKEIGADGYGPDAAMAVEVAKALISK